MTADRHFMRAALALAERGLGQVAPNPAVGCVLVNDGTIVGRGRTAPGGRPHAETQALTRAGDNAQGATAYVTLEPCAHQGATGPCAEALVTAGISRAVIAMTDPYKDVSGKGIATLKSAGVLVETGLCAQEAYSLNRGFFSRILRKRPLVTAKSALSIDGRIATRDGHSQWITGPDARRMGHMLRARHDAIAIGAGTLRADDPSLTCRLAGLEGCGPRPVIFAGSQPLPQTDLTRRAIIIPVEISGDWPAALELLAEQGITRLLLEGGGRLIGSALSAGVVDDWAVFTGPLAIGGDGVQGLGALGRKTLPETPEFALSDIMPLGPDHLALYKHRRNDEALKAACLQASSQTSAP